MTETNQKTIDETAKKAAQKAVRTLRAKATQNALATLKELVDKNPDPKYKVALSTVKPSLYGITSTSAGTSMASRFVDLVAERKQMNEIDVFKELKVGRKDCALFIRAQLKKAAPAERTWISFNAENGLYKLEGLGEKVPQNWQGFVPSEGTVDLNLKSGPEAK